jgi:hypothetical protein
MLDIVSRKNKTAILISNAEKRNKNNKPAICIAGFKNVL